jgi:hypothetical protein
MRKGLVGALLVAVMAAALAVAAAGAGARPLASPAAGCKAVHQNQRKTAVYSFVEHLQRVTDYGSGNIHIVNIKKPSRHTIGWVSIGAVTCLGKHGWRVLSPVAISQWAYGVYPGADGKAQPRGSGTSQGWGVAAASISHGTMTVRALACRKNSPWGGLKLLLSFPLPIPYTASLGEWVANLLLPGDNVKCSDLGYDTLRISATRSGALSVRETHYYLEGWVQSLQQSPNVTIDHTKNVSAPSIR